MQTEKNNTHKYYHNFLEFSFFMTKKPYIHMYLTT